MRIKSTFIFRILLIIAIIFLGWIGFENEMISSRKTALVSGKVIDVFPSKEVKNYNRKIKYVYSVDNKEYIDFKKLGTKDEKQNIGNELKIKYFIKNPKRNKVELLLNNYKNPNTKKYYSNTEKGYIEMYLINGIFKYKEYVDKGKVINDYVGDYSVLKDTIHFNHYQFEGDSTKQTQPLAFIENPDKWNQLIETNSKQIFTKLRNRN